MFTGGIGEHAAPIRAQVCAQLGILGIRLDPQRNADHGHGADGRISEDGSVACLVVHTNEELTIAKQTAEMLDTINMTQIAAD